MNILKETKIIESVNVYKVVEVRDLTEASYILRFNRNGLEFKPGQHLVVGIPGMADGREYSIFSGIHDEYLEILVREVEMGALSSRLRKVNEGDELEINGPFGFFMYNTMPPEFKKFVFIASGTGIAPFHSFAKSYPKANYKIIHGIRTIEEAYGDADYPYGRYFACTSGDERGHFHGRLTGYLQTAEFDKDVMFYFCGNNNMILDAMNILQERGFSHSQMYTEVYF
jgi:ferredoxin/flavodoxin---NADP+ reductase